MMLAKNSQVQNWNINEISLETQFYFPILDFKS